ncbi:MAG: CmcJ/NvfI family oxidoreductase [Gammaproteobacteria bacterium]
MIDAGYRAYTRYSESAQMSRALKNPPFVEADLNYIVDDGKPSIRYVDWPEEEHKSHIPTYEARLTRIHDARKSGEIFELSKQGFTLVTHPSAVSNFYDEDEIRRVYYPEVQKLVESVTGAARVVVFDHTVRTGLEARHAEGWIRDTVRYVHNDFTERSAPRRLRHALPEREAERALGGRYAIIQLWRSIAPRVESEPLALCDGRTIPGVGFVRNERRYRERTAETYHMTYNPAYRWYYFPLMSNDEAIVFKVFDSDANGGVRFTAHSAFDDPTSAPDAAVRESIEMRTFAFY